MSPRHSCDYVLCSREMQPKFIASFRKALAEFNPPAKGSSTSTPLVKSSGYSKIISDNHFKRLSKLLDETKGEIVIGGERDAPNRRIAVTVVTGVTGEDALMEGGCCATCSVTVNDLLYYRRDFRTHPPRHDSRVV